MIKFLERDEVRALINSTGTGTLEHALLHTLWSSGLRISEALSLERAPFEARTGTGTFQQSIKGKGNHQRLVFFTPEALQAIDSYLGTGTRDSGSEHSRLFPITVRTAQRIVDRATEKAGFCGRRITPHTFRHSLATHLLRQGANIRVVQEILGHRALSSTMVYTGVANKDLLEAHTKYLT